MRWGPIAMILLLMMMPAACWVGRRAPTPAVGQAVYIKDGDLWMQGLAAGQPRRLTTDGGYSSPAWSPSGQWVMVVRQSRLLLVRSDGSGLRDSGLAGGYLSHAAWAPHADRLAYRDEEGRLAAINADGTDAKMIVRPAAGREVDGLAWSPDGRWIAYVLRQQQGYAGLWRAPAGGDGPQELFALREPGPQCLTLAGWTADSRAVVFWRHPVCSGSIAADGLPLWMQPADGGPPRELVREVLLHPGFVAVSRRGPLAVTEGGGRITWSDKRIKVLEPWTGKAWYASPDGMAAISPAWAPGGDRLAYVAAPDAGRVGGGEPARQALALRHLWVGEADGAHQVQLTADPGFREEAPRWTGDGEHLLFCRLDGEARTSLWLMPAAGGTPRRLDRMDPLQGWFGYYGWAGCNGLFDYRAGPGGLDGEQLWSILQTNRS